LRVGHLFLLLSRFEGMPNALLEALNIGLPAIATDVGDLRSLKTHGDSFILIPTEDVTAAADAVQAVFRDWTNISAGAAKRRAWVHANFSEEACRGQLREILAELLKEDWSSGVNALGNEKPL
jgi:glycosyltransferase involved in cell wall biosynthesis